VRGLFFTDQMNRFGCLLAVVFFIAHHLLSTYKGVEILLVPGIPVEQFDSQAGLEECRFSPSRKVLDHNQSSWELYQERTLFQPSESGILG